MLSLGEQQLLAGARIAIAALDFAVLQQIGTTLGRDQAARLVEVLSAASVSVVAFGECGGMCEHCGSVLELDAGAQGPSADAGGGRTKSTWTRQLGWSAEDTA